MTWIDTHCHLDAPEFDADRASVLARARAAGVTQVVLPAVASAHFDGVVELARREHLAYALGLHPLWVEREPPGAIDRLAQALSRQAGDPRLVAVGECGLDGFVPGLDAQVQEAAFAAQLRLAAEADLPVILHVRRSADTLLKHLRRVRVRGGIAHAFNGSRQQAEAFLALGFKLGFGGTLTFERSLQIRRLAAELPIEALVLETDAPDIPPQWLYRTAEERLQAGAPQGRNEPAELPRIAAVLASLRGIDEAVLAAHTYANARAALPKLAGLARPSEGA